MNKNLHSRTQVPITIGNIFRYIMYAIVHFTVKKNLLNNYGTLKSGDFVCYSWRAKYYIDSVYNREKGVKEILSIQHYRNGSEHCDFVGGNGCDTAWLRKAYSWEIRRYIIDKVKQTKQTINVQEY